MTRPLDELEQILRDRAAELAADPAAVERSYTCKLLAAGVDKIGGKIIEEAAEVVEAASESGELGRQHLVYEAGDLIYHLLVLLRQRGIEFTEVDAELARRFGVSGLAEKASRNKENS